MRYYLAVDIGASSGRHILGWVQNGKIQLQEVYRFENGMHRQGKNLCWDIDALEENVLNGLRACKAQGMVPASVGIDTWAVDFVLLDAQGKRLDSAVAYRDARGPRMQPQVEKLVPPQTLYAHTGIQRQGFNSIYQLAAVQQETPEQWENARQFLMIPDYLHYRLCGCAANEYTNATSTSLVNANDKTWDHWLLQTLGYPAALFSPLRQAGETLGEFTPAVGQAAGFTSRVVLPPTHDTASAFLAAPAGEEGSVIISSGTWSLLGIEKSAPELSEQGRLCNFTNEGGYQYRFRYLKNIMGLWMIQSIRKELGGQYSYAQLEEQARQAQSFTSVVDVNDAAFLAPESMLQAVRNQCEKTGQAVPATLGESVQCVYKSLAACYAKTIAELQSITGKTVKKIHIVGGGSKDTYLNQLTANATGLPVAAGPTEATALGNLLAQFIAGEEFTTLEEARAAIRESFPITIFQPEQIP